MTDQDSKIIEEARDFLTMMQRAYHEVWRRRYSGDPEISPKAVMILFADCEHYRREIARLTIAALNHGKEPPAPELQSMDAVWRSLWAAVNGKRPKFVPPQVAA